MVLRDKIYPQTIIVGYKFLSTVENDVRPLLLILVFETTFPSNGPVGNLSIRQTWSQRKRLLPQKSSTVIGRCVPMIILTFIVHFTNHFGNRVASKSSLRLRIDNKKLFILTPFQSKGRSFSFSYSSLLSTLKQRRRLGSFE